MKYAEFSWEDIFFFPAPAQKPPFWVKLAGLDDCNDSYWMSRECSTVTVIEYVYSGTGTVCLDGREYHPSEGDVYILPERSRHTYYPDKNNPWKKIYVNLQGTAVPGLVQAFGLHKKVVYNNCQALIPIFEQLLMVVRKEESVEQIMEECGMLVMKLLTQLCRQEMCGQQIPDEVQAVKRFIDNNYRRNLTMDDIAASVYRSNDYVKKQFKQYYAVTPYAYYLDVKITHAKYLLLHTNMPIKQIADRLGYTSDRYFSKRFRQITGVTATHFRNSEKSDEI